MDASTPRASALWGLPDPLAPAPSSAARFPDGGAWRVEIPSIEGPEALAAVFDEADKLQVPIHRVSQGSGVTLLTDAEIRDMVEQCRAREVELCLFARPGADWDVAAAARVSGAIAARARGARQLNAVIDEIRRGAALGVRSFLVADEGALLTAHRLRESGQLPSDIQLKVSVLAGPVNPASFRLQELAGADTINVPSDLSAHELAELRAASRTTIDFYVEAPDDQGGFVRHWEIDEIARVSSPVYLKFGLRLSPSIYPAGGHLNGTIVATARERVRRARLGLDMLARSGVSLPMSPLGSREQPAGDRADWETVTSADLVVS